MTLVLFKMAAFNISWFFSVGLCRNWKALSTRVALSTVKHQGNSNKRGRRGEGGCISACFNHFRVLHEHVMQAAQQEQVWATLLEPECVNVGYTSLLSMHFSCAFNPIGFLACWFDYDQGNAWRGCSAAPHVLLAPLQFTILPSPFL